MMHETATVLGRFRQELPRACVAVCERVEAWIMSARPGVAPRGSGSSQGGPVRVDDIRGARTQAPSLRRSTARARAYRACKARRWRPFKQGRTGPRGAQSQYPHKQYCSTCPGRPRRCPPRTVAHMRARRAVSGGASSRACACLTRARRGPGARADVANRSRSVRLSRTGICTYSELLLDTASQPSGGLSRPTPEAFSAAQRGRSGRKSKTNRG
ncbi:hypothetical protein C8Q80DRAFT_755095 [Daedaleopsis nitida]|nr:hypothetical protein C8Q80DRAFT_755095 [Daedaleopsis nitida]